MCERRNYITPLAEEQVTRLPRRGAEPRWDASGVHHAPGVCVCDVSVSVSVCVCECECKCERE